ncbi:hypothetical protein G3A56_09055 [Rhizobium oryzihabitans]|uniref:Tail fiber protein n=1 Tax=Rhizobium oryzihabitans TaxID=2267833 RepID=A0A7L5BGY6_9HYPH|nr:hypothetical protein [Rhizobium oryzihabitans]QIB38118.1 hypothetical protein G3A56_09055 [Rhizobium oryzihabitans]
MTTVFPYEFRIVDETHVQVIKRLVSGAETVLTLGVHYTVAGVGGQTGSITILVPPAVGEVVKILRKVPFKQETALENQGAYFPDVVEAAFDLAAMRDQQLQEQIDRSVKIPPSADPEELDALLADVLRLSASADALDTVAAIAPQVVQVAAIDDEVVHVSDIRAAVVTVSGIRDEVVTVAGVAPAVQAVKDNLADVQNAAENAQEAKEAKDLALQYRDEAADFAEIIDPSNYYTKAEIDVSISDPFALQPIGALIALRHGITQIPEPPKNKAYRYILLTAGQTGTGAYNEGVLTSEVVSGSQPTVSAYATINLAGSVMNGQPVRLINTERRFLRAGSPGTLQDSAFGSHAHTYNDGGHKHTLIGDGASGVASIPRIDNQGISNQKFFNDATSVATTGITINANGDTETRSRNIGVDYYMRIK